MRRGLKHQLRAGLLGGLAAARAAPYEKGTETRMLGTAAEELLGAARAAPYEKGTETDKDLARVNKIVRPRARPPMRRGLKRGRGPVRGHDRAGAARAAPYEKGTET